jgi:hypothetical protein
VIFRLSDHMEAGARGAGIPWSYESGITVAVWPSEITQQVGEAGDNPLENLFLCATMQPGKTTFLVSYNA